MIPTSLAILALVALATSAPATPDANAPSAANGFAPAAAEPLSKSALAAVASEEEEGVPAEELGAGEAMEGAENIVFRPLFRYRERTPARRRVRNSNRRSDANYRRAYAARFPHHRYRPSPKRRTVPYVRHQILY